MTDDEPTRERAPSRRRALWLSFAVALAAIVGALVLQPWWLAPIVAHRLSASSGRSVHLDAMWLRLSASLAPVIELRGIRVDNAPWADSHRPFARLASATAVMSWRSLDERRPVIALMVLRDGEIDLERRSDGLRNWRLSHPDDRGPGRFKVLAIQGEQTILRFRHEPLALDLEVRATPNTASGSEPSADEPMPTRIDAQGTWRNTRFVLGATTAATLTLLETGRPVRLRGQVETGGVHVDLDGRLGDIVRWPSVDAQIALRAPSAARVASLFGARSGASEKALRVAGTLRGGSAGYALSALDARLGGSDFAGELRWQRGEQRDLLHAELTSASAELADLRTLAGPRPAATAHKAAAASAGAASAADAASAPAQARARRPLDVELGYRARRLRAAELPALQSAALQASLVDGLLRVPRFELGIGGGRVVGSASLALEARPVHGEIEAEASALGIEALLGERARRTRLSGRLSGRAKLQASGASVDALAGGAAGTLSVSIADGTISSLLDAKLGLQGGKIVRSVLTGADPIALHCAAAVLDVRRGVGRIRTLVVDTERTRTTGSGTVDLAERTLDVVLTPQAKQPGLFVLERSIRLRGPWGAPSHELVDRAQPTAATARGCAKPAAAR